MISGDGVDAPGVWALGGSAPGVRVAGPLHAASPATAQTAIAQQRRIQRESIKVTIPHRFFALLVARTINPDTTSAPTISGRAGISQGTRKAGFSLLPAQSDG